MLRVGLTGNLGSGKSTAGALFAARGAHLLSSDAIGRELMQPGEQVFDRIVDHFGHGVLTAGGSLCRTALARIAFEDGRVEELNAIVHPAVLARQAELADRLFAENPDAVLMVESALIFETRHQTEDGRARRFDRTILVVAPEGEKIARFVRRQGAEVSGAEREALEAEGRRRLALQVPDEEKRSRCDFILINDGSVEELEVQVDILWPRLVAEAKMQSESTAYAWHKSCPNRLE